MTNAEKITLRLKQLPNAEGLPAPAYQSDWAAGFDLPAALKNLDNGDEHMIIPPGEIAMVPTGHALELPQGYEAQLRPRSGLAAKHGVTVLNTPGTIDADYRGEIKAILINHGKVPFTITHGMRIAQMVIQKLPQVEITMTEELNETERAAKGFGSTGTK